jgi:protein-tyrosine-phosphatase/DNA-binding transcriptional ArsR family regulator
VPAAPPPFLRLASHPVRWTLLRELGESDRRVGELCALAGERQSLVSSHLRGLRDGGLGFARRSLADGRDTYYALDVARCGELLAEAGAAMHPALGAGARSLATAQVLFLCTGNSARSQMAEALAETLSNGRVRAESAGSRPKPLHPHAVRVMARRGIDISGHRSKHLDEFAGRRFDVVVTLCDRVREVCPEFPGGPRTVHWSLRDPAAGDEAAFEQTAAELERRIGFLLATIGSEAIHV